MDTYPENLILEAMQVLLGVVTLFFCCCTRLSVPVTVGYNPPVPAFFFSLFFSTNSGINLGQAAGKGWGKKTKKTLVLTLGSPPEKGGRKKNPGQPAGKGRKKKKKKKKKPWY
jgi:hypothetical protein